MNKIYKVIWSKAKNCYVVVSELAKRNGKCSSSLNKKIIASFLAAGLVTALPMGVEATAYINNAPINNSGGAASITNGYHATAWGNGTAQQWRATAWGQQTKALASDSTAWGYYSQATKNQTTAFGFWTKAYSTNATAFGDSTIAGARLSLKSEKVGNLTDPTQKTQNLTLAKRTIRRTSDDSTGEDYDHDNGSGGGLLKDVWVLLDENGIPLKGHDFLTANSGYQKYKSATGELYYLSYADALAVLDIQATNSGRENATAWGKYSMALGQNSTAFGFRGFATAENATAFGHETTASGKRATAFGINTNASGRNSTSFGYLTAASGENSTAFGSNTQAVGGGATSFGAFTEARAENSTAWGLYSIVSGGKVTIDNVEYTDLETKRYDDISENFKNEYYLTGKDANGNTFVLGGRKSDGKVIEHGYKYTSQLEDTKATDDWIGEDQAARTNIDAWIESKGGEVAGQYSTAFGYKSEVYAKNALGALGGKVQARALNAVAIGEDAEVARNAKYAIAMGSKASATLTDSVALGSNAVADRAPATNAGHDVFTGNSYAGTGADSPVWKSTLAAVSVGGGEVLVDDGSGNMVTKTATRQITGVAAGSEDTDAVNVAQLKKAVWNVGIAENGGKVNRPERESSLKVSETVVGNGRNKVQFVAGKGITLTSKDYTTDTAKDTYGIVISTRFQELEANNDDQITAIWYDGDRYTIASGGTAAPAKVTTDHRALNIESIQLPKLDEQGKVVKDDQGNVVTEEYRAINSPYLHINGLQKDPTKPYAGGVAVAPEYQANAAGTYAIAMGREADALQTNSIAIGHMAEAGRSDIAAVNSVALGYRAHALANNSVSVGTAAFATGNRSIAIGVSNVVDTETTEHNDERAWAAGQGSMVLGNEATAVTQAVRFNLNNTGNSPIDYNTNDAIALGTRSDARALNAIALGGNMSYTIKDGERKGEVVYGAPEGNARNFGATVGEGARSAIAIGGAYGDFDENGNIQLSADGKTIKAQYAAATSYGAKGIAIGSGALIGNNEDYLDLQKLIDNKEYQGSKDAYYKKRHAFTVAERAYNDYVAANGASTTGSEYNRLKENMDAAKVEYNKAADAFSVYIREKIALEEKNASSVEDAVAIGAGSRTGVAGGIALGSQAKAGYLDRSGTESAMTGYDMQTGLGYYGKDADDPTWKATHAALSIGTLSTSNSSSRDANVTRRITNVAAGVFDRDAVNVAQLKRATTFTTDYRNVAIGTDAKSYRKIQSPYAHFEGVREISDALSITEYGKKQDYIDKVSDERTTIQNKIKEYNDAITELDKRLNGDTTTEGIVAKMNSVPESNPNLKADYQKLITDINYEKKILGDKITDLTNELNLLPTNDTAAGTAYDNAEALVKTQAKAYGKESIAFGKGSVVGEKGDQSIALGVNNTVTGSNNIAVGTGHKIYGKNSGAFGDPTEIDDSVDGSYAIGNSSHITTSDTFILGNNVTTTFKDSVFLGTKSGYTEGDSTAGVNGYGTKDDPVEINGKPYEFAGATPAGVVSVGSTDNGTRRIQNVAAGLISKDSTDAINGSQLYAAMQALSVQVIGDTTPTKSTTVTKTTAGGEGTGTTGTGATGTDTPATETSPTSITLTPATTYEVKASTTTIYNTDYHSKSGNLTIVEETNSTDDPKSYKYTIDLAEDINVDSVTAGDTVMNTKGMTVGDTSITKDEVKANQFTAGNTTMNNDGVSIAGGSSPVNLTNAGLKVGGTTVNDNGVTIQNGPSMTKDGIDAGGKKITNVAPGENDTDAVNVSQLRDYAAGNSQALNNLGDQITNVDSRAKKGIAGAAALAALHPLDFDPDDKLTFAAGMGHYRGETAAALGMFYRPDEKVMFSLGGTVGNGENMVNAGVSFSLDRTPRVTGSRTAMAKEIVQLREQVAQLTALVNQIAANQGMTMPVAPTIFPDTPENHYAYVCIDQLQKQGYITGYAGRTLTRQQIAAALDMAMAGGATLDERLVKEFEPELSHVRVAHVEGKGNEEGEWYERPRASHDKYEDKHKIEKKPFRVEEKKVTSKS